MCSRIPSRHLWQVTKPASSRRLDLISATSRIVSLGRSGRITAARKVFDEMPHRDTIAWNAMLTAYAQSGHQRNALMLFSFMRCCGFQPDPFSSTAALAASADLHDLSWGMMLHALLLQLGLLSSLPPANSLIDMYAKCACLSDAAAVFGEMEEHNELSWCSLLYAHVSSGPFELAHQLFDEMPIRGTVAWNIMISGYARSGDIELCTHTLKEMQVLGIEADDATLSILINACLELQSPYIGYMIHALVVRRGWHSTIEINNSLLSFYSRFGFLDTALRIFESMDARTCVSWNAMIHATMKNGNVQEALSLFDRSPETNIITWTSMIAGLARNGHGEDAVGFFINILRRFHKPDDFAFGGVLHACAITTSLECGKMIHGCVIQSGFCSYLYVANGLVDMYAKCGDIEGSCKVFNSILQKDLVSWNVMLFGYALHGLASQALEVYKDMLVCGIQPDEVTFAGLLMACSHCGFLEQGKALFEKMKLAHGFEPTEDHLACIIDMYWRAGHLREASESLARNWKKVSKGTTELSPALLSTCFVHGSVRAVEKEGVESVNLEPHREVSYVMLSNMYCAGGQWQKAEKIRNAMTEQGLKKSPGCSWIEMKGMVRVFVSGAQSLEHMIDVDDIIGLIHCEMTGPSFIYISNGY